ncbi:MAG TPA: thioredoxin domain-containing protein, partial [Casimicrobiaceae bacterium]|nr:thioredoxin domain-containing protein [Casimicrobiaceae bacterium]
VARAALFARRETRVRPGRDDKILTSWNALAIGALARASRAQDEPAWGELALAALDTLVATAWRDGRLYATRHGSDVALNAYLDDHAFLLAALIEVMQLRFRARDFSLATQVAERLLDGFEDREHGGFWFTSHDHERLYHRTKPAQDNATPAGNGVAAQALLALGHLAAAPRYVEAAERTLRAFAEGIARAPNAHVTLVTALERIEHPPSTLILCGDAAQTRSWQCALEREYRPELCVVDIGAGVDAPAALRKGAPPSEAAVAWLCHGLQCLPPITTLEGIEAAVSGNISS